MRPFCDLKEASMMNSAFGKSGTDADQAELDQFAALADEWWDTAGPFKPLHRINPARIDYICDQAVHHFRLRRQENMLSPLSIPTSAAVAGSFRSHWQSEGRPLPE